MDKIKSALLFIQQQTAMALDTKHQEDNVVQEYFEMCYMRLYITATGILPLLELLDNYLGVYYSIGLIIRPVLLDVLSVQYIIESMLKQNSNSAESKDINKFIEGYIYDGIEQIWKQTNLDLGNDVISQDTIENLHSIMEARYPQHISKDEKGNHIFTGKTKADQAYYLYKNFNSSDPDKIKFISAIYYQYSIFSKLEHLSRLTFAVANVKHENKILEIEKTVSHFLYHLAVLFRYFADLEPRYLFNYRTTCEKINSYLDINHH